MTYTTDAGQPATTIEARKVTFEYVKGSPVLQNWSASFSTGSMTALTGPSGRGKSTMLYLLGLMLRPTEGEILVNGVETARMSDSQRAHFRAEAFGFVFQDSALDATRSLIDNVTEPAFYRGENRERAAVRGRALLNRFNVDLPANRKPGQVSGGQAQRIALSRALITDPAILLADEPTGNLDPITSGIVIDALRNQARSGSCVIIVTHSPELADQCDEEIQL